MYNTLLISMERAIFFIMHHESVVHTRQAELRAQHEDKVAKVPACTAD